MKLTYDGEFGHVSHDLGVVSEGNPAGIHYAPAMGTFDGHANARAIFAEEAQWRTGAVMDAARAWDSYAGDGSPFKPNPWLGEGALPAPGQPHPAK